MTEFEIKHGLSQDEPGPLELAASPVSTVEQGDAVKRLRDAIEGECSGVWISEKQAIAVLAHLNHPAPAAGDHPASFKLVHLAVAEDGVVRFMTGRKLPDGIESCELYAMPDYGRAPAELFTAPATGDAQTIERMARAMALASGWGGWDKASTAAHTPNGNEPEEEREHWRDMARAAIAAQRKGDA